MACRAVASAPAIHPFRGRQAEGEGTGQEPALGPLPPAGAPPLQPPQPPLTSWNKTAPAAVRRAAKTKAANARCRDALIPAFLSL